MGGKEAMAMAAGAAVPRGGGIGVAGAAAGGVASEAAAAARRIVGGEAEREVGKEAGGAMREDRGIEGTNNVRVYNNACLFGLYGYCRWPERRGRHLFLFPIYPCIFLLVSLSVLPC